MCKIVLHLRAKHLKNIFAHGWESYKIDMFCASSTEGKLSTFAQNKNSQLAGDSDDRNVRIVDNHDIEKSWRNGSHLKQSKNQNGSDDKVEDDILLSEMKKATRYYAHNSDADVLGKDSRNHQC